MLVGDQLQVRVDHLVQMLDQPIDRDLFGTERD